MVDIALPLTMHITDDPDAETAPAVERQLSARDRMMQQIAERAEAHRQAEIQQGVVYDEDARDAGLTFPDNDPDQPERGVVAPAPAARTEPVERPREVTSAPGTATTPVPSSNIRTIVMDGREVAVTEQQLVELARLGMVANVAMHQYREPALPAAGAPDTTAPPARQTALIDPQHIRETVKQIQYGGEDAAAEALTRLVTHVIQNAPQPQQIDQEKLIQRAAAEARAQAQLSQDTAQIRQEYAEIFNDPQRTLLAKLNVEAIRSRNVATNRQQSDLDIYREAGNAVYDALGKPRPGSEVVTQEPVTQAAPAPVQLRADVLESKRGLPRRTAVIDRRAPAPAAPRTPTGSSIVDQMRLQRGQQPMR